MTTTRTTLAPGVVTNFWFAQEPARWFAKNDAFDAEIRETFALWPETLLAEPALLQSWLDQGFHGHLAAVITLDQFPRNLFRGTSQPFDTFDPAARSITKAAVAKGLHTEHETKEELLFLLLPLMHSEMLEDQEQIVALLTELQGGEMMIKFAKDHMAAIQSFGRFPHRNAVLGRESTEAEQKYLDDGGGF